MKRLSGALRFTSAGGIGEGFVSVGSPGFSLWAAVTASFVFILDKWPSGQWQQTVNLSGLAPYEGSNPSLSTIQITGILTLLSVADILKVCPPQDTPSL
jgi:hypothetical protein